MRPISIDRFVKLLCSEPSLTFEAEQKLASSIFPAVVRRSRLRLWSRGEPLPQTGRVLLVGAAVYSWLDMKALDKLDAQAAQWPRDFTSIEVFESTAVAPPELLAHLTDIGSAGRTLVLGMWQDGRLIRTAVGRTALDEINRICGG